MGGQLGAIEFMDELKKCCDVVLERGGMVGGRRLGVDLVRMVVSVRVIELLFQEVAVSVVDM